MIDLINAKFGDMFETRDGHIAVVYNEHQTSKRHWYDLMIKMEKGPELLNCSAQQLIVNEDGTACDGDTSYDLVKKL